MLSIQSIMLVALGFLTATLLALTFAPAFWSRAVRLTTQRIKERLPVTETEIREGLEGNLCRCTGYHNIVKSIAAGAKAMAK